jgi:hypothetical protein
MLTRGETHDVVIETTDKETDVSQHRKTAIIVGTLFIAGDVAGVISVVLTSDLLKEPDYLTRIAAHQNRLVIGALCVLAMGFLLAAIPVVMYPIFRRYNRPLAMGYVVFRGAIETVTYIAGAVTSLLLLALSRDYVKAGSPDTPQFGTVGRAPLQGPEVDRPRHDDDHLRPERLHVLLSLLSVSAHSPLALRLGSRRRGAVPRRCTA